MRLINCDFKLFLTWSANCVISAATVATIFVITNKKCYALVLTL